MDIVTGMNKALEFARDCALEGVDVPVGCAIYKGDRFIAGAMNTRQKDNDISGHAEIKALKAAAEILGDWRLSGCELYVTLEPCPMCAGAIADARISALIYGAERPGARAADILPRDVKIVPGVCESEAGELLSQFFKSMR